IPFGPMRFWGAWFLDMETWNYDFQEFWLDSEHKWTPTPVPTDTPIAPTDTPSSGSTNTPTPVPTDTPSPGSTNTPTPTPTDAPTGSTPTGTPTGTPTNTSLPTNTPTFTPSPTPTGFVYIPAGTYMRGSPEDEPCRDTNENQHQVTLTNGFFMMQTEVTRQMWADLKAVQPALPDDPSDISKSPSMNHPAQGITWYEAVLFANLMSVQEGYTQCYYKDAGFTEPVDATNYTTGSFFCNFYAIGYRLPTEAEWEYACRAGTTGPFSCNKLKYKEANCSNCATGTHPTLATHCVYCANSSEKTEVVGSKLPNTWELYDMHGNAEEWCWDWYGPYPSGPVTNPKGPTSGSHMVVRGGSWASYPRHCRSAHRGYSSPDFRNSLRSFRLLRTTNANTPTCTPTPTPTNTPTPPIPTGFVYIPAGTYLRGSPGDEPCRVSDETQHQVTLTHAFYMMQTEVTRQMWADLKAVQPTLPIDLSDTTVSPTMHHPVQNVSWYKAVLFANLMSLRDGYTQCYYKDAGFSVPVDVTNYTEDLFFCNFDANGYRLPTEAEWEYACRAETTGPFSCNELNYQIDNCESCAAGTHPILEQYCVYCANSSDKAEVAGSKLSNPWGLYDMHGNVFELCWDWYDWLYPSGSVTDPKGPATGSIKVVRGGSWLNKANYCRSASREFIQLYNNHSNTGFRLVRSINDYTPIPTPPPPPTGFVYIPDGTFTQGSPPDEPGRWNDETQHQVLLTSGFYMMKTEMTRQMWADLKAVQPTLPNDPSDTAVSPTMDHPVQKATWFEALLFANLMSLQDGYTRCYYKDSAFIVPLDATNYKSGLFYCDFDANGYRLPTEAEWEYACRAETTWPFSCDELKYNASSCESCTPGTHPTLEQHCAYCANDSGTTMVVGSKLCNPWGLYDMHGNEVEWCWDRYGEYPSTPVTDPTGPSTGTTRVLRSGTYGNIPRYCRSAFRFNYKPDSRVGGFRFVKTHNPYWPTNTPTQTPTNTPTPLPPPAGFVTIQAGTYMRGSPEEEPCRDSDETQHQVTLTRAFYMMQTEVTRQMWADLKAVQSSLPTDPSDTTYSPTMNHPVQNNTWYEAILYANLMSVQKGYPLCYFKDARFTEPVDATNYTSGKFFCNFNANGYRLPTEAEWEYACRAGTTWPFSCNETNYTSDNCISGTSGVHPILEQYCVYRPNSSNKTEVVASKLPNPWGLYDMHGNVSEWCWDRYNDYPSWPVTDPEEPTNGSGRIIRGGSWNGPAVNCRSAHRMFISPDIIAISRGFRLVRTAN
ncbi:MAG: formylglycine-generating enzyme family protein, partial [bacterium]